MNRYFNCFFVFACAKVFASVLNPYFQQFGNSANSVQGITGENVLLVGPTGGGKSFLANCFSDSAMKVQNGEFVLAGQGFVVSSGQASATQILQRMPITNSLGVIDTPGLNDTQGSAQNIANLFKLSECFVPNHKVKIVLVANAGLLLVNRGDDFRKFLKKFDHLDTSSILLCLFSDVNPAQHLNRAAQNLSTQFSSRLLSNGYVVIPTCVAVNDQELATYANDVKAQIMRYLGNTNSNSLAGANLEFLLNDADKPFITRELEKEFALQANAFLPGELKKYNIEFGDEASHLVKNVLNSMFTTILNDPILSKFNQLFPGIFGSVKNNFVTVISNMIISHNATALNNLDNSFNRRAIDTVEKALECAPKGTSAYYGLYNGEWNSREGVKGLGIGLLVQLGGIFVTSVCRSKIQLDYPLTQVKNHFNV